MTMTTGSLLLPVKGVRLTVSAHHGGRMCSLVTGGADGPSVVSADGGVS